jgi:glycosyltransferase involved in cell wall biosynthesis
MAAGRAMKVIQLGPYPPPHGGVQTNLVAIREYLLARGHSCLAINLTRFRRNGGDGVHYPRNAVSLARLLFQTPADILHLHYGGDLTHRLLLLAFLCSLLPGRKVVLTFHSGGYPSSPAGQTAGPRTLRGFILRRLNGLIAVNPEIAALLRKFGVRPERVRTIPPFAVRIPGRALAIPDSLRSFMASHSPLLLTVGLLEIEYDLSLQIEVTGEILQRFPRAGLILVGSGSLEAELRRQVASKPYAESVILCGDVAHAAALRVMLECDVLLRTTIYDGDSIAVREALCIGIPVIATDNGMRPPGVRLITASNRDQLRDALVETLVDRSS